MWYLKLANCVLDRLRERFEDKRLQMVYTLNDGTICLSWGTVTRRGKRMFFIPDDRDFVIEIPQT